MFNSSKSRPLDPHALTTSDAKPPVALVLYGHADCSLCDRLEAMIEPYLRGPHRETAITLVKRDITSNSAWHKLYRTRIPVLTYGDLVILEGRPDCAQVTHAMARLG